MASGQPAKVFVSSTAEDLKAHREAARDAVLAAGMLPVMMEYFAASGEKPPLAACLAKASETDVLLVIVAHRYGWVPPDQPEGQHKSITRLECEKAVLEGKEVLAFLVDEKHPWPEAEREAYRLTEAMQNGSDDDALYQEVRRNVGLLKEFKAWLNGRGIRDTFTTPQDIRRCVAEALNEWKERYSTTAPVWPAITIRSARYGAKKTFVDVTDVLSRYIRGGRIQLKVTNAAIVGTNDPCPRLKKQLLVNYSLGGKEFSVAVTEGDDLILP